MKDPMQTNAAPNNNMRWIIVLLSACFLVLAFFGAYLSGADGDEGMYLLQARSFAEYGSLPGIDYYSGQTAGFFILYGVFMKIFGYSFEVARMLSVFLYFGTVCFFYLIAKRLSNNQWAALFLAAIFICNHAFFKTDILMKHYAPCNFFLMGCVYFLIRSTYDSERPAQSLHYFLAGLFLGLAFNSRFHLIVALIPFIVLWVTVIHWIEKRKAVQCVRNIGYSFCGFWVASPIFLYVLWKNPVGLYFNHYLYPLVLSPARYLNQPALWENLRDCFWAGLNKQNFLIVLIAVVAIVPCFFSRGSDENKKRYALLFVIAAAIVFLYSLSPIRLGPSHYSQATPYWSLLAMPAVLAFLHLRLRRAVVAMTFSIILLGSFAFLAYIPLVHHRDGIIRSQKVWSSLGTMQQLGDAVSKITHKGEYIIDWYCAAAFLSGTRNVKGFEQAFDVTQLTTSFIPDEGLTNPPAISKKQLREMIQQQAVNVIVVNEAGDGYYTSREFRRLVEENYVLYQSVNGHKIYVTTHRLMELHAQTLGIHSAIN